LKFIPKVGPFKALDFKIPTQKTEDLYIASVNHTVENYKQLLGQEGKKDLHLTNTDFDTGRVTHAGEYVLSDQTYARLLDQLAHHNFDQITPDLRDNILAFYGDPTAPITTKKKPKEWQKTQEELQRLRALSILEKPAAEKSSNLNERTEQYENSLETVIETDSNWSVSEEQFLPSPLTE
jgi:hypothetical protein